MKKILIAIDDGPTAEKIAEHGFGLARLVGAETALLSVVDSSGIMTAGNITPREMAELTRIEMKKFQQIISDKFSEGQPIMTFVETGKPSEVILKTADEWDADLIVLGTHGRTGLTHLLMGSVAEKVIRHSKKQVLVIPTK